MSDERKRTFDLNLFNMANDAYLRASRIASLYDMSEEQERPELLKALRAEIALGRHLIRRIVSQANTADQANKD